MPAEKNDTPKHSGGKLRRVRRFVHRHRMFRGGDRVAVGVSGGKDSSLMLYILVRLREEIRGGLHLEAFHVADPASPCFAGSDEEVYGAWCRSMGVPFHVVRPEGAGVPPKRRRRRISPCFRCSRRRRETLFKSVRAAGFTLLALGHTGFDAAVTAMMNLCRHGKFETMPPALTFFGGEIRVIRPLLLLDERDVIGWVHRLRLPQAKRPCPPGVADVRKNMEAVLRRLSADHPASVRNIVSAAAPFQPKETDISGMQVSV